MSQQICVQELVLDATGELLQAHASLRSNNQHPPTKHEPVCVSARETCGGLNNLETNTAREQQVEK